MKFHSTAIFTVFVILPIMLGTVIYVGWREPSLFVFDWMATCGIPVDFFRSTINLPRLVLYSLPDGCWVFAGTSWMLIIWHRIHPWVFVFAVLGIGGEFGQALQLVPGAFDWNDIVFYIGGFIFALVGYKYAQTQIIYNRFIGHGRACCG